MSPVEQSRLDRSEKISNYANDLLEQAPAGEMNNAVAETLTSLAYLRMVVREQQKQIEALQASIHSDAKVQS